MRALKLLVLLLFPLPLFATNYYLSNQGKDTNNGLTKATPFQTIAKLNRVSLSGGDSVLFRGGDEFYGQVQLQSGSAGKQVVYSSYGEGLAMIHESVKLNNASQWVNQGGNIWKIVSNFESRVAGVVFNESEIFGINEFTLDDVNVQGDFYSNGQTLYIYSTSNPASYYSDVRAYLQHFAFKGNSDKYFTICNLKIWYAHYGIQVVNASNVEIYNCDIRYIGGGLGGDWKGAGNGIEFWASANNIDVHHNYIYQCYDAGVTPQYNSDGNTRMTNITFRDNYIDKCEYGIEFFNYDNYSTITNVKFINNIITNSGYGWGHIHRESYERGNAIMLWTGRWDYSGINISGNIMYNSRQAHIYGNNYHEFTSDYNLFLSNKIARNTGVIYQELEDHQAKGFDLNSIYIDSKPMVQINLTLKPKSISFGDYSRINSNGELSGGSFTLEPFQSMAFLSVPNQTITSTINFEAGWNMFSFSLIPLKGDFIAIMDELIKNGALDKVQDETGRALINFGGNAGWVNNLDDADIKKGYKIKVNKPTSLSVTGNQLPGEMTITLKKGWNILPYNLAKTQNGLTVLDQLIKADQLIKVIDEDGNTIDNPLGVGWSNNIGNFVQGEAYEIKVKENTTLNLK